MLLLWNDGSGSETMAESLEQVQYVHSGQRRCQGEEDQRRPYSRLNSPTGTPTHAAIIFTRQIV